MPELASLQTQPPHGSCPSAEDLACYVDGALSPEEAARVTEHLASCESCFEVYSGVLQFQLKSEPARETGKVVRFPVERRRPPVAWWSSIAALLMVGLGFGVYSLLASPPELLTADVTAPIPTSPDPKLWRGPTTRGVGGGEEGKLKEVSFKMGVQLVNLQVSLKAGKAKDAEDIVARIIGLLRSQTFTKDLETGYTNITSALERGQKTDLLSEASRLARLSRDVFESSSLDFGQWVEAGRLASLSYDPAFFRVQRARTFLRRSLWRDRFGIGVLELPKPGESRGELNEVYKLAGQDTLQPSDFVKLQGHFKKILDANYPE